ncbi:MAG: glycosyltransferase family 39 protein [Actinobacteria bacterium]|nr:glycosyltransferase family 39 protein [Chloroflexota bacterium]MBE3128732.1 glycosyltransferase family 39 protein [Actinomycetota bacterium]
MNVSKLNKKNIIFSIILITIFLISVFLTSLNYVTDEGALGDSYQYVTIAYNIVKYKSFSLEQKDQPNLEPTAFRTPVFPLYLAFVIATNPELRQMSLEDLFTKGLKTIRYYQIPLIIIISFLVMYMVHRLTKNHIFSYLALFLTGSSISLLDGVRTIMSENIAALLLLIVSILLYDIVDKKENIRYFTFILLGIFSALVVLTKPTFQYLLILILIVFIILFFKNYFKNKKRVLISIFIFLIINLLIIGPWAYRNYKYFGNFFISNGGGGGALLVRAEENLMNSKEFIASFFYFTPTEKNYTSFFYGGQNPLIHMFFNKGDVERLDWTNSDSYWIKGATLFGREVTKGNASPEVVDKADKEMQSIGIKKILSNPLKHLSYTLVAAWKGIFIEEGFDAKIVFFNIEIKNVFLISFFYFTAFLLLIIYSIKKRFLKLVFFLLPSLYLYSFNSFLTIGALRFNMPMIPVMIVSISLIVFIFKGKIFIKNKQIKPNIFNNSL